MKNQAKNSHRKRTWAVVVVAVVFGALVLAVIALAVGRGGGPRAPALRPEPVYSNAREGFRFVAPEGWALVAKADLPPGPAEKERLLVRYQATSGGGAGAM